MDLSASWDFTLANYSAVWAFMVQLGLLLLFLMLGNILRRTIPVFRKCLVPSALLGGALLLAVNILGKQFGARLQHLGDILLQHPLLAIGTSSVCRRVQNYAIVAVATPHLTLNKFQRIFNYPTHTLDAT